MSLSDARVDAERRLEKGRRALCFRAELPLGRLGSRTKCRPWHCDVLAADIQPALDLAVAERVGHDGWCVHILVRDEDFKATTHSADAWALARSAGLGGFQKARIWIRDALLEMAKDKKEKKAKDNQGQQQAKLAQQLMKDRKYRDAIDAFSHAISLRPENDRFYFMRGNCFRAMGAFQRCLFDYSMAIRIKEDSAAYYGNRGLCFRKLGRVQEAIRDYNRAIEIEPVPNHAPVFCGPKPPPRLGRTAHGLRRAE